MADHDEPCTYCPTSPDEAPQQVYDKKQGTYKPDAGGVLAEKPSPMTHPKPMYKVGG